MQFKSIIKEGVPTANGRIYEKGSLQKFKDYLQEKIDNKTCFVWMGQEITEPDDSMIKDAVGVVESIDVKDGQAIFDITLFDTPRKQMIELLSDDLLVDFLLCGKTLDELNNEGYKVVDTSEFTIAGVKLAHVKDICKEVELCV